MQVALEYCWLLPSSDMFWTGITLQRAGAETPLKTLAQRHVEQL